MKRAEEYMGEQNFFGFINLGETHSPYKNFESATTDDIIQGISSGKYSYEQLHEWQVDSARRLLTKICDFRNSIPEGTTVVVTSDHGELFGGRNAFGHNPHKKAVFHEKLLEVP